MQQVVECTHDSPAQPVSGRADLLTRCSSSCRLTTTFSQKPGSGGLQSKGSTRRTLCSHRMSSGDPACTER